LNYDNEKRVGP